MQCPQGTNDVMKEREGKVLRGLGYLCKTRPLYIFIPRCAAETKGAHRGYIA